MEQESFDIGSLEGFRADLVASGFEPVPSTERRMWQGPIHPAFDGLTDTRTVEVHGRQNRLRIVAGHPVRLPEARDLSEDRA